MNILSKSCFGSLLSKGKGNIGDVLKRLTSRKISKTIYEDILDRLDVCMVTESLQDKACKNLIEVFESTIFRSFIKNIYLRSNRISRTRGGNDIIDIDSMVERIAKNLQILESVGDTIFMPLSLSQDEIYELKDLHKLTSNQEIKEYINSRYKSIRDHQKNEKLIKSKDDFTSLLKLTNPSTLINYIDGLLNKYYSILSIQKKLQLPPDLEQAKNYILGDKKAIDITIDIKDISWQVLSSKKSGKLGLYGFKRQLIYISIHE